MNPSNADFVASERNLARMAECLDYARCQAGFTEPGYGPNSWRHHSGLAILSVTDPECGLRLAVMEKRPNRYGRDGYTVIETGSLELSNLAPDMFASVLDAVTAHL